MEELDLREVFTMFWSRKLYVIIIIAIFIAIGVAYSYIYVSPVYKSEVTLVLVKANDESNENTTGKITTTDLTLNQKLISTYRELLESRTVISTVINNLQIEKTENQLRNNINISNKENTDLLIITVTDENPESAKIIANETAKVFSEKVANDMYKNNNVQIISEAEVNTTPSNINHIKDIIIFAFIGVVLAVIYVLIANLLDTTIKGKEDIEKKLGVTVLTTIPICNFNDVNQKKGKK